MLTAAQTGGRGGPPKARAAIIIAGRKPGARESLHRELSRRYGADYRILVCRQPGQLAARIPDLRAQGLLVALVISAVGAQDPDGIEVLAAVRRTDPTALRVAAVGWGDWESVRSVFHAVMVGTAIAVGQAYSAVRLATYSIQDTAPFAVTAGPPR